MKSIVNTFYALAAIALVTSCSSDKKPNYQYFPNMYESVGYEAYSSHEIFSDNNTSEALTPVEGTVSRGWLPYDYENSPAGYASAKASLKNPIAYTEGNLEKGKALYDIYCAICHGTKGDGKGTLVKREKILGVPAYNGREITEGSIYHVMYYGINSMGSYAAQTSIEERWLITQYVESLRAKLNGESPRVDSVKTEVNDAGVAYPVAKSVSISTSDSLSVDMTSSHSESTLVSPEKSSNGFSVGTHDHMNEDHLDGEYIEAETH